MVEWRHSAKCLCCVFRTKAGRICLQCHGFLLLETPEVHYTFVVNSFSLLCPQKHLTVVTFALPSMTSGGVAVHSLRSYDQGHIPLKTSALGSGLLVAQAVIWLWMSYLKI